MDESAKHETLYLAAIQRIADLKAEVEGLQAALRPFAVVALPDNWPGNCVLTWQDYAVDTPEQPPKIFHGAYAGYLHYEAQGGPTIADYRRAAEALAGSEATEAEGEKCDVSRAHARGATTVWGTALRG